MNNDVQCDTFNIANDLLSQAKYLDAMDIQTDEEEPLQIRPNTNNKPLVDNNIEAKSQQISKPKETEANKIDLVFSLSEVEIAEQVIDLLDKQHIDVTIMEDAELSRVIVAYTKYLKQLSNDILANSPAPDDSNGITDYIPDKNDTNKNLKQSSNNVLPRSISSGSAGSVNCSPEELDDSDSDIEFIGSYNIEINK